MNFSKLLLSFLIILPILLLDFIIGQSFSFVSTFDRMNEVISAPKVRKSYPKGKEKLIYEIKRNIEPMNNQPKVPHPYLGYVFNRATGEGVNRDGFRDKKDLNKTKDSYVIGIFGGSVAHNFAVYVQNKIELNQPNLVSDLVSKKLKFLSGKKILIYNFSLPAYRQPQTLITSLLYIEKLDMAITIDGYNEASSWVDAEFKFDYPHFSNLFYNIDPSRSRYWLKIYDSVIQRKKYTNFIINNKYLKKSSVILLFWKYYDIQVTKNINEAYTSFKSKSDIYLPYYSEVERQEINKNLPVKIAKHWFKYSLIQHQLMKKYGVRYFHFLQPNQHIMGSKILTEQEKKLFLKSNHHIRKVTKAYEKILEHEPLIKANNNNFFSLINIFKKTKYTVYKDSCCHLNIKGKEILERTIVEKILSTM